MIASNNFDRSRGLLCELPEISYPKGELKERGKFEDDVRNVGSNPKGVSEQCWITDGLSQGGIVLQPSSGVARNPEHQPENYHRDQRQADIEENLPRHR